MDADAGIEFRIDAFIPPRPLDEGTLLRYGEILSAFHRYRVMRCFWLGTWQCL